MPACRRGPQLEAEALARRGEAYRVDGQFREAEKDMIAALDQARTADKIFPYCRGQRRLGSLYLILRRMDLAERFLQRKPGRRPPAGASAGPSGCER